MVSNISEKQKQWVSCHSRSTSTRLRVASLRRHRERSLKQRPVKEVRCYIIGHFQTQTRKGLEGLVHAHRLN